MNYITQKDYEKLEYSYNEWVYPFNTYIIIKKIN